MFGFKAFVGKSLWSLNNPKKKFTQTCEGKRCEYLIFSQPNSSQETRPLQT